MPESRFPPIILLTLLIACLCIYGIILQPDLTFAGMDFINLGYPKVSLARDALAHGHLPLWNWYEWGGVPLLASLLGALMYPPTWLAMLLPLPYGLQLFTFAHLLIAGIGAFAVGQRTMHLSRPAAAVCGIVYMGNAFFPGRIEQFQVVAVNSLFPWLVLAIASVLDRRSRGVCLAVCWCATLLAGHPQFALFNIAGALFFAGVPFLYLTSKKPNPLAAKARAVAFAGVVMAGAIGLGTATAAFQLLPTWELGALSERIWPYADPTQPQLEWRHLPAMVIPQFYNMLTGEHGRVFGFTELGLYAGILALPLAITGAVAGLRTHRPVTAVAIGLWVFAMLFALGANGKLAPFVFENIPFFTQSRGAARSLNVAALMLALLTGRGAMAVIHLAATAKTSKRVVATVALGAIFVGDIALNNYSALQSILVPTRALGVNRLLPVAQEQALKEESKRLYRFMATDSDLYLNNSTAAVAERVLRLQPNLNSLDRIALADGYEEGLMPPRNRANLLRGYNRNLRSDSPDAALLAFMGSNLMLTEYPLPPGEAWATVAPPYVRPAVVPGISGPSAVYTFSRSAYEPSLLLDPTSLIAAGTSAEAFFDQCAAAFPVQSMARTPASTAWTSHPLEQVPPGRYRSARSGFTEVSGFQTWNCVTATKISGTSQVLVLIPPYPGWKAKSENYENFLLKPLCSLFYLLQLPDKDGVVSPVNLIFSPFSAKFGLFISLLSGSVLFSVFCNCLRHRIFAKK